MTAGQSTAGKSTAGKAIGRQARHWSARLLRPHYHHIIDEAARLGAALGYPRISVLELGVAGGRGLLAMEAIAASVSQLRGIEIEVYGLDSGSGLPAPEDHRDLPYHWRPGFYRMEEQRLRSQLTEAQLLIGDLAETVPAFLSGPAAPLGAVSVDVDYYSSTRKGLALFAAPVERLLPRMFVYFDDIIGGPIELYGEYTGELAAIGEFNAEHEQRKLHRVRYLDWRPVRREWHGQIFGCHAFDHPDYGRFVSTEDQHLPLNRLSRWLPRA